MAQRRMRDWIPADLSDRIHSRVRCTRDLRHRMTCGTSTRISSHLQFGAAVPFPRETYELWSQYATARLRRLYVLPFRSECIFCQEVFSESGNLFSNNEILSRLEKYQSYRDSARRRRRAAAQRPSSIGASAASRRLARVRIRYASAVLRQTTGTAAGCWLRTDAIGVLAFAGSCILVSELRCHRTGSSDSQPVRKRHVRCRHCRGGPAGACAAGAE